jgi:acyl-CoA thioesterase I
MTKIAALLALALAVPEAHGAEADRFVVFFGDSITAGYGVDPSEAYPALVQKEIDALGWPFTVVNAGLSGDTTAAAERRLDWVLKRKADVLVIALGGNDGLRGVPPEATRASLQRMIDLARRKDPAMRIVLAAMRMPPNYGEDYAGRFAAMYPALARKNGLPAPPFLLEGVGGDPALNLPDRIHPTAEGHRRIARTMWKTLKPILSQLLAAPARP